MSEDIKYCEDCAHHIKVKTIFGARDPLCAAFPENKYEGMVTRRAPRETCKNSRYYSFQCGEQAMAFKPK